jgi:hypothetical protein
MAQVGSAAQLADPESTGDLGAHRVDHMPPRPLRRWEWGAILGRRQATQSLLGRSISAI